MLNDVTLWATFKIGPSLFGCRIEVLNNVRIVQWRSDFHFHLHIEVRNKIPMEIRCKGVPKFNCTFLFDTDQYCDQVFWPKPSIPPP